MPRELFATPVAHSCRRRAWAISTLRDASEEATMITGAHAIIYSVDADADRAFMGDVLGLPAVDVGGGWLIFGLPPSEVAVHPAEANGRHELYFLVADVNTFVARMKRQKIECSALHTERWGVITNVTLPGGGTIGV